MALHYWSIDRGQTLKDVADSAVAPTADIVLAVDVTAWNNPSKNDVLNALKYLEQYLLNNNWTP